MSSEPVLSKLEEIADSLKKLIETIESDYARTSFQRDMEYYNSDEPAALPVTAAASPPHEFKERPVKFLWLYAQGANIQVSLDKAVSGESFVIPAGAVIWVKKSCRRVYGQTLAGAGILWVWGFW